MDSSKLCDEPRQIKLAPGGHYDIYGMNREEVITTAREWFVKHLQP